jgi:hypothetical protein
VLHSGTSGCFTFDSFFRQISREFLCVTPIPARSSSNSSYSNSMHAGSCMPVHACRFIQHARSSNIHACMPAHTYRSMHYALACSNFMKLLHEPCPRLACTMPFAFGICVRGSIHLERYLGASAGCAIMNPTPDERKSGRRSRGSISCVRFVRVLQARGSII